jgi:hypothetical protein
MSDKKINECPECQYIEDDQYECCSCGGAGGIFMYAERDDDGKPIEQEQIDSIATKEG